MAKIDQKVVLSMVVCEKSRLVLIRLTVVIDGWGIPGENSPKDGDAITNAETPVMDEFMKAGSSTAEGFTELEASSHAVGLPEGLMGNSEVGHLNIGAGRVVWQDSVRIENTIKKGEMNKVENVKKSFQHAIDGNGRLHFLGLISDGGVHSHINHLFSLLEVAKEMGVPKVFIHFFGDGRDTDPKSAAGYMQQLLDKTKELGVGELATVVGRYYIMDRDKRWDRVETGMKGLVTGEGEDAEDPVAKIKERYENGENDEFLKPIIFGGKERRVQDGDTLFWFNYRSDRVREAACILLRLCCANANVSADPAPGRYRPLPQARLSLSQGLAHYHYDKVQDGLSLPYRFCSTRHGRCSLGMAFEKGNQAMPCRRNREVWACHILLQWWRGKAIPWRRTRSHSFSESCDLRS